MVNITLLGEQSVVDPVTERTLTLSARSVALLGLLISRTGSPQSRSAIAGAFWPDSTERQALTNLRRELHDLRQLIDDDSLEVAPPAVLARPGPAPGWTSASTCTSTRRRREPVTTTA